MPAKHTLGSIQPQPHHPIRQQGAPPFKEVDDQKIKARHLARADEKNGCKGLTQRKGYIINFLFFPIFIFLE